MVSLFIMDCTRWRYRTK